LSGDLKVTTTGLRRSLEALEEAGLLRVFGDRLSVDYEIAKRLASTEGRSAALFTSPVLRTGEISQFRVVGGVASGRGLIAKLLGVNQREIWRVLR